MKLENAITSHRFGDCRGTELDCVRADVAVKQRSLQFEFSTRLEILHRSVEVSLEWSEKYFLAILLENWRLCKRIDRNWLNYPNPINFQPLKIIDTKVCPNLINFNDSLHDNTGLMQNSYEIFKNITNLCRSDKTVELSRYCHHLQPPPTPSSTETGDFPMISFSSSRNRTRQKLCLHFPLGILLNHPPTLLNHISAYLVTDFLLTWWWWWWLVAWVFLVCSFSTVSECLCFCLVWWWWLSKFIWWWSWACLPPTCMLWGRVELWGAECPWWPGWWPDWDSIKLKRKRRKSRKIRKERKLTDELFSRRPS